MAYKSFGQFLSHFLGHFLCDFLPSWILFNGIHSLRLFVVDFDTLLIRELLLLPSNAIYLMLQTIPL